VADLQRKARLYVLEVGMLAFVFSLLCSLFSWKGNGLAECGWNLAGDVVCHARLKAPIWTCVAVHASAPAVLLTRVSALRAENVFLRVWSALLNKSLFFSFTGNHLGPEG
jgi:hypothetical protein